jgi:hypothetical protein
MEEERESMEEEKESCFALSLSAFWVSLIECYGSCLRGFILFFILILIKKKIEEIFDKKNKKNRKISGHGFETLLATVI